MIYTYKLIDVLEASIKKNGNQPLTTQHLLNILKYAAKSISKDEEEHEKIMDEALMEIYADQCCDRE
jgi:hypothetical protein